MTAATERFMMSQEIMIVNDKKYPYAAIVPHPLVTMLLAFKVS